jgi:tetratricopeptide (TPR) repeat protein
MSYSFRYIVAALTLLLSIGASAQNIQWPNPEVEQLYNRARQLHSQGNMGQAISLYQQAITIAPEVMVLYRELGKAYYLAGGYEEAQKTLIPIIKSGDADEQCYQALAASYSAQNEFKKAKRTLDEGIQRYRHSGLLYHQLGKLHEDDKNDKEALRSWLLGIEAAPDYHVNYYEAARIYMQTDKFIWTIIYGEIFINLEKETPRSADTRKMVLQAYRRLYGQPTDEIPKYGSSKKQLPGSSFEDAVYTTYMRLAPVVSDGVTTENLTMLRTRFMMDWTLQYANKYPYTLYIRQDNMIRNGYFDIYNQWLFGKAENTTQFQAWNNFHTGAITELEEWLNQHPLQPVAGDAYNNKQIDQLFSKK